MQKQRSALFASAIVIALIALLAVGFFFTTMQRDNSQYTVTLPSEMETVDTANTPLSSDNLTTIQAVSVTPDNVQALIASLVRPESYSCTIENQLFWADNMGVLQCTRYVRAGAERIDTLGADDTVVGVQLYLRDDMYLWTDGDTQATKLPKGDFSTDAESMLPDYQTVVSLPKESIQTVSLTPVADDMVLTVQAVQADMTVTYTLSVLTGLLMQADYVQAGTLVRSVVVQNPNLTPPDAALFILPNAETPIYE